MPEPVGPVTSTMLCGCVIMRRQITDSESPEAQPLEVVRQHVGIENSHHQLFAERRRQSPRRNSISLPSAYACESGRPKLALGDVSMRLMIFTRLYRQEGTTSAGANL